MSVFDTLLLQHVVWQRPEEAARIREWLLVRISQNLGIEQVKYMLSGLYGRACRSEGRQEDCDALLPDVDAVLAVTLAILPPFVCCVVCPDSLRL